MIRFSAPGKIHLLGEHTVVYGKPALLTTVGLRAYVTIDQKYTPSVIPAHAGIQLTDSAKWIPTFAGMTGKIQETVELIVKKHFKAKTIPPYQLEISSQIPLGCGLGSSAAISAAYIAALLSFLKVKWDKELINNLTYKAEKVFHGNPSGGDNSAVIYGGLISYTKGKPIQPLPFSIPDKLAKSFILINTGTPKESTKEMVELVESRVKSQESRMRKIFDDQEQLVKKLLLAIQANNEDKLIQIIKAGEKNLESIGVVSSFIKTIIRQIEKAGGAAKICGGGGKTGPTGVLLCFHSKPSIIQSIANSHNLTYFKTALGVDGLKNEN